MRVIIIFLRRYPLQSALILGALLFTGVLEGLGISLLLPLLGLAANVNGGSSSDAVVGAGSTLGQIVNNMFGYIGITPTIGMLLIIFAVFMSLKALILLNINKRVGYVVAQVVTDLRLELINALFATRWEYFIKQSVGSLANSIGSQTGMASRAYISGIKMLAAMLNALVYAVIALLISWKATLVAAAAGITILFALRRFIKKSRRAGEREVYMLQSMMAYLTDSLIMIKPLKTMALQHLVDVVLKKKVEGLKKALKKLVFSSNAMSAFQEPLTVGFTSVGLYFVLVVWKMPLASVLIMVYMFAKLMSKIQKVQSLYQMVAEAESAYWSYESKLQMAVKEKEPTFGNQKPSLNRSVRLEQISFAYTNRWILKDADFVFPANTFTAIVGPSGIGKTTVVDLLTGLLRPQEGEILIDDIPLAEIDLRKWRRLIGYVPQETILLHESVFINVTLGDRELKAEDVESAMRAAGAWDFVQDLPEGLDTVVGERGSKLSGGQRQRIAIARALVHQPKLLILDEATTALDPEIEAAICETLQGLKGNLTILAISHQPAILKVADRAYRLENGKASLIRDMLTHNPKEVDISAATA